ncbi:MAG: malate/lactate/ureidoglycolate dehydrogenase [Rubrivivax sp.]|nr:malate/lactate/ureidoglycolate dehydrogenase [Rubrivivax sp.]MCL4698137.1 malate/lactate/ureidoglycolate dehydrogenase [Burkholderiaceae bacterium]
MGEPHLIAPPALLGAIRLVVAGFGSDAAEIDAVAGNLVEANLTGHDSHGIGMLPRYAEAYREGGLQPNMHVRTVLDAGALLRLDGGAGFGQVVGREAMALGIERARRHGTAVVALGNAHHLGRIGAWAEQAAAAGLVSLHFVNVLAPPIVAPHGGAKGGFGTNPFTAGVPLAGRAPLILDFATSMIAHGKTRVAFNKGEPVPEGCLIDDQGRPSTDPRWTILEPNGAILAFGAHKGYGLAVVSELLGGALAAGMVGHREDGSKKRILNGMLSVLVDPAALGGTEAFVREAEAFVKSLLDAPPRPGFDRVRIAGDPERECRARRSADGVPVDAATWQQILQAAQSLGVDPRRVQQAAGTA